MNEHEAIQQFVRDNLTFLTSNDFSRKEYKDKCKKYYFEKHKNKFGTPNNKEVMIILVEFLKSRGMGLNDIKDKIENLPFFKEASEDTIEQLHKICEEKKYISDLNEEQIQTIASIGAYNALEALKGKVIEAKIQKELEELNKQIELKKSLYESLETILDSEKIEEPTVDLKAEETKQWWQRFYLKSDPFPRKDGLSLIDASMYEQVIIKTKPFQDAISNLQRNPNCFFNIGTLLVGGYGYGKTTFIDYLSHFLIQHDIIPIRIACGRAFSDNAGFADSFYQRLRKALREEAGKMTTVDDNSLVNMDIQDQVIELASRIVSSRKRGILIFMDDYHKHQSHLKQIFEFLGTLQVLKDDLAHKNINVGFIVSGVQLWKDELIRNQQLTGFLDNAPIEMPDITPGLVCDVFNRRISAFCYESTPRYIKPEFVEKLAKELEGQKPGFREYINSIINELSNNNMAIVNSPIQISDETLKDVKAIIELDDVLRSSFVKLTQTSRFKRFNDEQIAKCLELLVQVGIQNGIGENDKQFIENKYYFLVLKEMGLIQKQKPTKGSTCEWAFNPRLRRAIIIINNKHKLNPSDYLLKIYAYKDYSDRFLKSQLKKETDAVQQFRVLFNNEDIRLPKTTTDHINTGLQLYDATVFDQDPAGLEESHFTRAFQAIEHLSAAFFELDEAHLYFYRLGIDKLKVKWMLHPFIDETIQELFARIDDYEQVKNKQNLLHVIKSVKCAVPIITSYLMTIIKKRFMQGDISFTASPLQLTDEEVMIFNKISDRIYSGRREDHFDYIKDITEYLERRIKSFLFFTSSLLFGDNYFEQCPRGLQSYAFRVLDNRASYALERNKFNGLTRPQFKKLFTEGNSIKWCIIDHLMLAWQQKDWELFLEIFSIENIKTSHQHIDNFSHLERQRYLRYCKMIEELLVAMNKMVSEYIEKNIYICAVAESHPAAEDCLFQSSIKQPTGGEGCKVFYADWPKNLTVKEPIFQHTLKKEVAARIINTIKTKIEMSPSKIFVQDMLDTEYIIEHYGVKMTDFVNSLAYSKNFLKDMRIEPWFNSSIAAINSENL